MEIKKRVFTSLVYRTGRICNEIRRFFLNLNPYINIGNGTVIEKDAKFNVIDRWGTGNIVIGKNCYIGHGVRLQPAGKGIVIGDNATINSLSVIYGQGGVKIGNNVLIASSCVIVPTNHNFSNPSELIRTQGQSSIGITIEDDVWLGCGVRVLDDVTIKKGSVIGAGAVVTKDTEINSINVGVPSKKISSRNNR